MAKLLNITSDVDGLSIGSDISAESGIVKSSLPLSLLCGRHIASGITTQLMGTMAGSDFWRLAGGATASDSGFLEIATADNGSEPIYVRQYTGKFTSSARTLKLLDESGNTEIPGRLNLPNANQIYWKETGYGDQFAIKPNFSGADDNNVLQFQAAVGVAGTTPSLYNIMTLSGKSGNVVAKGEIQSINPNAFRLSYGNYGVILRNAGDAFFILLTDKGSAAGGTWNSYRPFSINFSTGVASINGYPGGVNCGTGSTPSGNKGNIYIQY